MILELQEHPDDHGFDHTTRIERLADVQSLQVKISNGPDGDRYPRLGISTPHNYRDLALRPEGPVEAALFDDDVHRARESAVCGPNERWVKTVVDEDLKRAAFQIAHYGLVDGLHTEGDVIRAALEAFLADHVDSDEIPDYLDASEAAALDAYASEEVDDAA